MKQNVLDLQKLKDNIKRSEMIYNRITYQNRCWEYLVDQLLKNPKCVDCGEADIRLLDWDYRLGEIPYKDSNGRSRTIARLINDGSLRLLQKEIEDKCVLRCVKCKRYNEIASLKPGINKWLSLIDEKRTELERNKRRKVKSAM